MECISTPLSEDQLLAAMSDVAEDAILEHLRQCTFCKARLDRLKSAEERLIQKLYRGDCPDAETLGEFALNMLPEARQTSVAEHVHSCPRCRQDLAELKEFWDEMDQAETHERDMIQDRQRPSVPARRPKPQTSLTSMHGSVPVRVMRGGMRGDGPQSFELDGLRLVVSATQEEGYYELNGQLLGPDVPVRWRNGLVKAQQGEARPVLSIVNERGKFQCRLPTADDTDLTLTAQDGTTLLIEAIKIAPG